MGKKLTATLLLLVLILAGCAKNEENNNQKSENINTLNHLAYCNIDDTDICVEGFGKDDNNSLLILFKAKNLQNIVVYASGADNEKISLQCYRSDEFSENIYCTGRISPENGENIKIDVFDEGEKLLGSGNFLVQYGQLDFLETAPIPQPENTSNYPNQTSPPDYPNYPNYPNQPNYPNYPNSPNYSN